MIILDRNLTVMELTIPELVYLKILEENRNYDYEMPERLQVLFGLDENMAFRKVDAYLKFRDGETL